MTQTKEFKLRNQKIHLIYSQTDEGSAEEFGKNFLGWFRDRINFTYIVCGKEQHEATDGWHYHLFFTANPAVRTDNCRYFDLEYADENEVRIHHPQIKPVTQTPWLEVEYAKKEDKNYWEYLPENAPTKPLRNYTIKQKNKMLRELDPLQLLDDDMITPIQAANLIKAKQVIGTYRDRMTRVKQRPVCLWFYGKTGTGKTRTAVELAEEAGKDYWISHGNLNWFDGYNGQEYVIIDDFRRGMCDFHFLLRLTDRYIIEVPIKGGFVNWNPKVIIITCPVDIRTAWTYFDRNGTEKEWDHIDQLIRRFKDREDSEYINQFEFN